MYNESDIAKDSIAKIIQSAKKSEINIEIIVIDDCSTDDSVNTLKSIQQGIVLLSTEKNSGSGGPPRNIGIEHAKGKYITFYDMGDNIRLDHLHKYFKFMDEFEVKITIFKHQDIRPDNSIIDTPIKIFNNDVYATNFQENHHLISNPFSWSKIYNKKWVQDSSIRFGNQYLGEDKLFTWGSYLKADTIVISPEIMYQHKFYHGLKNRMSNVNLKSAKSLISIDKEIRDLFKIHQLENLYNNRLINRDILQIILGKEGTLRLIENRELFETFDLLSEWIRTLSQRKINFQDIVNPNLKKSYDYLVTANTARYVHHILSS